MDDTVNNETQKAEPAAKRSRVRIPDKHARLTRAVAVLGAAIGRDFDPPTIEHVTELDDTGLEAMCQQLFDSVDAALRGSTWTPPPSISWKDRLDAILEDFHRWQMMHGAYHRWKSEDMARLRAKLQELGDHKVDRLQACFALSVGVVLKTGSTILIDRNGRETLG